MKKIIAAFLMASSIQVFAKADKPIRHSKIKYSKVVKVHGMVCAFCSNSLEKKFKKKKAVKKIDVDLESKIINIKFKKGKYISDKKLKEMITSSGFKVVSIEDHEASKVTTSFDKK